jgi:hypothetical protein
MRSLHPAVGLAGDRETIESHPRPRVL